MNALVGLPDDDIGIWADAPNDGNEKLNLPLYDWKDASKDPFYISEIEEGVNTEHSFIHNG